MNTELKKLALIPARVGSLRVKQKNIRPLRDHPLLAYTITSALKSGVFDRVVVSTDSEEIAEIARYYGAETPFLRPSEFATSTAIDAQWISHAFSELKESYDLFSILRPTSPFRLPATIQRAMGEFLKRKVIDSIRAVELCHEHPGKMWKVDSTGNLEPLIAQPEGEIKYHAKQYQDLPKVYVQNSSLEIAWSYVIPRYGTREGKTIAPFFTENHEGFSIDYESEWKLAEIFLQENPNLAVQIDVAPFKR